jgi:hypothetical protein
MMKSYRILGIVLAASLACLIGVAQADTTNLVSNGEFDTGISDWHDWNGKVTPLNAETSTSPNGASVSFGNNAWFSTNPATALVAGQTYELSLYGTVLSAGAGANDVDKTLYAKVALGSTNYVEFTPTLTSDWKRYSIQFTPTSACSGYELALLNSIANEGNRGGGVAACVFGIDSVSLSAVPEPSAITLMACGVLGLVAYAWRKRS